MYQPADVIRKKYLCLQAAYYSHTVRERRAREDRVGSRRLGAARLADPTGTTARSSDAARPPQTARMVPGEF